MQDVKGLKVLQVLPDEGGRTKSLFELCLNFRITISPLENWPPGLIVFGKKKKKQIWIITALGFLYSCCNINEDKQIGKCSDKGAKSITCQQICIKKTNLQNFSNFGHQQGNLFRKREFHLGRGVEIWALLTLRMVIYWCDCSQCLVDHYFVEFHRNPKIAVCSTSLKAFPSPMETERGNFLLFVAALRIKETTATLPRLNLQGTECKNSHSQWREELPPWPPSDNSERSSTQQHKSAGRSRAWAPSLTRIWAVTKWI